MPIVTVAMYEGRTLDQKRELVKGITDVVARVTGNTPDGVHVVIEVVKGSIKVRWEAEGGKVGELVAREGEQIFLPRGLSYALQATGEPAINVFAIAGGSTSVGAVVGPEGGEKLRTAGARLS